MRKLIYSMMVSLDGFIKLRLLETRTFSSGVVYLRYEAAG